MKRLIRRRWAAGIGAIALAFGLLLGGCSSTGSDVIRIYASIPLQGASGPDNATVVTTIKQALAAANYHAGQYKIEFVPLDGSAKRTYTLPDKSRISTLKWDAAQERKNARRAAADPAAVAYIGTINSGAAAISIPILNRAGLAMISPANSNPGLTKTDAALAGEPYKYAPLGPASKSFCRTATTDDFQGADAALYLKQKQNVKSVYVLDDTEVYGRGVARIFAAKAGQIGLTVLSGTDAEHIDIRSNASYTDLASKIVKAKPDAVYFGGVTDNRPADVLKALRAAGFQGIFMGADGIAESAFEQLLPSSPGKVFATILGLPPDKLTGPGAVWYRNWKALYPNTAPSAYAPYAYDATNAVLSAIAKAGKIDNRQALRAAVLGALKGEQNVQGITGTFSFDGNCDTTLTQISVQQFQNTKFQFLDLAPTQ